MPSLETVFKWLIAGAVVVIIALLVPAWIGAVAALGFLLVFVLLGAALIGIATMIAAFGLLPASLLLIGMLLSGSLFDFDFQWPDVELINWVVPQEQFVSVPQMEFRTLHIPHHMHA